MYNDNNNNNNNDNNNNNNNNDDDNNNNSNNNNNDDDELNTHTQYIYIKHEIEHVATSHILRELCVPIAPIFVIHFFKYPS